MLTRGQRVFYISPVNWTSSPSEVLQVNEDGTVDLRVTSPSGAEHVKLQVLVIQKGDREPFVEIRGQKIPRSHVIE